MDVFILGRKNRTNAEGIYNPETGELIVKKGSIVSENVAKFNAAQKIRDLRNRYTDDNGIVLEDLTFQSASSAASFVAGYSANGLLAWHVEKHVSLKDVI